MLLFTQMVTLALRAVKLVWLILQNNFWPKINALATNLHSISFFLTCVKLKPAARECRKNSQYEFRSEIPAHRFELSMSESIA